MLSDLNPLIHCQAVEYKERNPFFARAPAQCQIPRHMMDHHGPLRSWKRRQVREMLEQPIFQTLVHVALQRADLLPYRLSSLRAQTIEPGDDLSKPAGQLHPVAMR